ncbi:MAG: acetylglutamate kinase [Lachnospiraceae bacterium]|nr:acetylglutamate kinase [Lachnospiraceae bacterium]
MNEQMKQDLLKAVTLSEALPYMRDFNGKIIVIQYDGLKVDAGVEASLIEDIALLKTIGMQVVIVQDNNKTDLVEELGRQGLMSIGISGKDGHIIRVEKKKGMIRVGEASVDIKEVDTLLLNTLMEKEYVPVIEAVGVDDEFHHYSLDIEETAFKVAVAMQAEKLVILSETEGIYRNPEEKTELYSHIGLEELKEKRKEGLVGGGFLPKINHCIEAIEKGVGRIHIVTGKKKHSLLLELFTVQGIGTAMIRSEDDKYAHELGK